MLGDVDKGLIETGTSYLLKAVRLWNKDVSESITLPFVGQLTSALLSVPIELKI